MHKAVSRDLGLAIGVGRWRSMSGLALWAVPLLLLDGEVAGAGASLGYRGSRVAGVGQDR
jgi:hypothetical protein